MFCDLVGSTGLSKRLDPEALSEVMDAYRNLARDIVKGYGGTIAQYLGDGILAYFGYPIAQEHDAERAVSAGLDIVKQVRKLCPEDGKPLEARVGIASGVVVVGDMSEGIVTEKFAVGETPNLAARLQAIASPGSVVIDEGTLQLLGRLFEIENAVIPENSGLGQAKAYRVAASLPFGSRFEAFQPAEPPPLVNREHEVARILRRWSLVRQGAGQVIVLTGEAGIGKSRLASHVPVCFGDADHALVKFYCSPLHTQNALFPLTAYVSRAAGFGNADSNEVRREKLLRFLPHHYSAEDAVLISDFMGLGAAQDTFPRGDAQQRERFLSLALRLLLRPGRKVPLVLLLDDAQWIDPTSLELLNRLVPGAVNYPILILITARPEFKPVWMNEGHVEIIPIEGLKKHHSEALIAAIARRKPLPRSISDEIYERTDGVPLFIEEMTKALLEGGDPLEEGGRYSLGFSSPAIPFSLQHSLLARLDRLGSAKKIAQAGAAIGREFPYQVIRGVAGLEDAQLAGHLESLVESGLVHVRGVPPESSYLFKHALVQDAAYETILKRKRPRLHDKIARTILDAFPAMAINQPEIVAHHLTLAEDYPAAIKYWIEFGKVQIRVSADLEAIGIFNKALSLAEKIADDNLRDRLELQLHAAVIGSLVAVNGPQSDEVAACCERGGALARALGEPRHIFPFLYGQYTNAVSRGRVRRSAEIASSLIETARALGYKSGEVLGHRLLGLSLIGLPRFEEARQVLETGLQLYQPERDDSITYLYGQNVKVSSQTVLSFVLYLMGETDLAIRIGEECITSAECLKHSHSYVIALHYYGCNVLALCEQYDKVGRNAEKIISISEEFGLRYFDRIGRFFQGLSEHKRGETGSGIRLMEEAICALEASSFLVGLPYYLTCLAEAKIESGLFAEALAVADKADRLMRSNEEFWIEPEVLSVRGQAILAANPAEHEAAKTLLEQAIQKARQIGSPTLERRCLQRRGRLFKTAAIFER
jgi:class 3 adenylate cyclase/tetratricopeptide (TPR) repeat protein